MKNRFVLTGTDNDGFRHRYSIKKKKGFKKAFVDFMITMDFDPDKVKHKFMASKMKADGSLVEYELKVKEIEDECWHFQNKKFDVDVFFGRFKIIFVVRAKDRVPFVDHLENRAHWIRALTIKKIKEKSKHKIIVPSRKY